MKCKGAVVISETMLLAFGIIVSFVLLATMGSMIMKGQSEPAEESAMLLVAKDIASTIDRVAAEAGSVAIVYRVPKGMKVDVGVDYKRLKVSAEDKSYSTPFQVLTHTKTYVLDKPKYICMVKNQDDMRITLSKDKCICNTNDNRCDPACVVNANCDPDCNVDNVEDRVCDSRCSAASDNICDPDCFTNDKDKVNEAADCIKDFDDDGNGNRRSKEKDRICDADSHMIEDAICDIDCLNNGTSSWGICDIDCNKYNTTDINGILVSEDGYCDLDCGYEGTVVKRLYEDGVCDLDCAGPVNTSWLDRSENGICDPDCGGLYDPDCGKCAGLGADCSSDPCCGPDMGMDLVCCPGPKTCAENKDDGTPACEGNGWCEISPFSSAPENPAKHIVKWPEGVDGTHPKNWENPYTTQQNVPGHLYKDCTDATDGICYSEHWCETDILPCATYSTDNDGYYDEDCGGEGNGCQWICMMPQLDNDNVDCGGVKFNQADQTRGRESTVSSNFCSTTEDGFCDPDCDLSKWKRWDPDCGEPDCDAKVDKGQWTKSVVDKDGNVWYADALEICHPDVMTFLDRRGWDINQVVQNWKADPPDGWAFDGSRYNATLVQPASETISHNEDYFADFRECCPPRDSCYGDCAISAPTYDKCCKVGYCGDHSAAVTTILRTLGVPAHNIWSAFYNLGDASHAWNLLHCDSSIKNLGKYGNYQLYQSGQFIVDECNSAGDGNWIVIDATFHAVSPLSALSAGLYCTNMKDLWNDHGRYGFQGIVCDGAPVIPTDADNCEVSGSNVICDCPGCTSCSINHPHASTESCNIVSGRVSCPFKRNPKEAGNPMGC
ncbi:MAG: hypothetical protein U9Q92_04860 [archaeon]|nr:hypothetical protein [archaeon]